VSEQTATDPGGIELHPGEHVCALYLGAEARDEIVVEFLRRGLAAGDKCICILDEDEHQVIRAHLGDQSVRPAVHPAPLDMLTPWKTYLRSVEFSSVQMLAFLSDAVTTALGGGSFDAVRVTGESTWMLSALEGTIGEFMSYESELNRFVQRHPVSVLCLYDLDVFGGGILVDLLKTHPKLLLGGMLLENPHALSPDEFVARG
jgi:MEDS: MEthanogen/methylotroph, DcmR Sensory domain